MLTQLKQIKIDEQKRILDLIYEKEKIKKSMQTSLIPYKKFNFLQRHIFQRRKYKEYLSEQRNAAKKQQERDKIGSSKIREIDMILLANGNPTESNVVGKIRAIEETETIQDLGLLDTKAIELLAQKGIEPILTINDKEMEKRYGHNNSKRIETIDDLVLVHVTKYFPEGGIIRTPKEVVIGEETYREEKYSIRRERDTIHFAVNGEVTNNTGGSFNGRPYAIIIPLSRLPQEKIIGGSLVDLFTDGSVELPEGSYILCPEGEEIGNRAGDKAKVIRYEGKTVDGYANLFISQLGYKEEDIGFWKWESKTDNEIGNNILKENNWWIGSHTDSQYEKEEKMREAISRNISRVKILIKNGIKNIPVDENPENDLLKVSQQLAETSMPIFEDENVKYLSDLYERLAEIGLEIPESVIDEIETIKSGNYVETREIKQIGTKNPKYLAERILSRRIIGEVELKKISESIQENPEDINFDEITKLFKGKGYDYTTGERKIEFLKSMGIQLSDIEKTILNDKNLIELYSKIQAIKDIPLSNLSKEDKIIIMNFKKTFEHTYKMQEYFIVIANTHNENYFSLYPKHGGKLSEDILSKLGGEILEDKQDTLDANNPVFNFRKDILECETLTEYCTRYHEYVEKISELVGEKEREGIDTSKNEVPVKRLGAETLEEQNDTAGKDKMKEILESRIREFVVSMQNKKGEKGDAKGI